MKDIFRHREFIIISLIISVPVIAYFWFVGILDCLCWKELSRNEKDWKFFYEFFNNIYTPIFAVIGGFILIRNLKSGQKQEQLNWSAYYQGHFDKLINLQHEKILTIQEKYILNYDEYFEKFPSFEKPQGEYYSKKFYIIFNLKVIKELTANYFILAEEFDKQNIEYVSKSIISNRLNEHRRKLLELSNYVLFMNKRTESIKENKFFLDDDRNLIKSLCQELLGSFNKIRGGVNI